MHDEAKSDASRLPVQQLQSVVREDTRREIQPEKDVARSDLHLRGMLPFLDISVATPARSVDGPNHIALRRRRRKFAEQGPGNSLNTGTGVVA
jgi:hypothetical protein